MFYIVSTETTSIAQEDIVTLPSAGATENHGEILKKSEYIIKVLIIRKHVMWLSLGYSARNV